MITYEQIAELSEQTSLPLIEIIRALQENGGDSEAARAALTADSGRIDVADRKLAENLATKLVDAGLHFVCETTPQGQWLFRVSAENVTHIRKLGALSRRQARATPPTVPPDRRRASG
ncbi:MAG: hypothetical protein ACHP7D_10365 [Lysobacterales bacterium]